jgi:uncharacterized repeat protein (TIGR01451 family)
MTPTIASRCAAFLAGCLLLLLLAAGLPARADTPVSLFQSFRGNVNFVGTTETLRSKDNKKPCTLVKGGAVSAQLSGIPSGATIKSAQVYWAASGTVTDYAVSFDGTTLTAPTSRQYVAKASANNTVYTYFSGAADVTSQVSKKGNGSYSFSGLSVNTGDPWCSVQGVVGGFALVVVYSHPDEPFRMLNLYEGFQDFQNTSLTINLGNFNVPNPLPTSVTGRVGHITWEGDATLSQGGEDLLFNGVEMTDSLNPKGNQFNSASNVTGDATSFGIDFDVYTLKSPVIQPGQSTATTTYKSGQDLVILSAEIVAMPYVANADLALAMTRTGNLTVGSSANYTLTVTNNGIDAETGPVTVIDTLPAGLKLVSAGGTGWTCTNILNNGQTIVTCTQNGPLASGAKMTPLVIAVTPAAVGNYTNSATVYGKTGDNNSANNTATDTSTSVDNGSAAFLFTREACTDGQPIVTSPDDVGCHKFLGPVTAADPATRIYITAVSGGQKATARNAADTTVTLGLAFNCLPNSGVTIGYAGKTFDCVGTAQTLDVKFPGGKPSALLTNDSLFSYYDVGRVTVALNLGKSTVNTVVFISRPFDLGFDSIRRGDNYPDQKGADTDNYTKDDSYAFIKTGAPFTMRVGARMANRAFAPSFGKEAGALAGKLSDVDLKLDFRLDRFTVKTTVGTTSVVTPVQPVADLDGVVADAFSLDQDFKFNSAVTSYGVFDATARWFEADYLGITPYLVDYLGTGQQVGGPPAGVNPNAMTRLRSGTRIVGRFYPDHFETEPTPNFDCLPAMNCPAAPADASAAALALRGATYSRQPFKLLVKPCGPLRDGGCPVLQLFQHSSKRQLKLSVAKAPNDVSPLPPASGGLTGDALPFSSSTGDAYPVLNAQATYTLGAPYLTTAPRAGNWSAPIPIYFRASMDEAVQASGTPILQKVTVSSIAPAVSTQYENGLMVVAGRVAVPNLFGSELLRLPVPLTAQYWTGSAWVANGKDNDSKVAADLAPANASSCTRSFAAGTSPGPCKPGLLSLVGGSAAAQVTEGKVTRFLVSPGRGNSGSIDYIATGSDVWLPTTAGRATFGLYKSPLIYLREVY